MNDVKLWQKYGNPMAEKQSRCGNVFISAGKMEYMKYGDC